MIKIDKNTYDSVEEYLTINLKHIKIEKEIVKDNVVTEQSYEIHYIKDLNEKKLFEIVLSVNAHYIYRHQSLNDLAIKAEDYMVMQDITMVLFRLKKLKENGYVNFSV